MNTQNDNTPTAERTEGSLKRVVSQRVVITLTDNPDKTVGCKVDFNPSVSASDKTTPAIQAAMTMLEALNENLAG